MGCFGGQETGVTWGHATPAQTLALLQLRQLSRRQQLQQGQNWDKMVSYQLRKIDGDIFSVLSLTAPSK
jgi:hypothetical protein